VLQQWRMGFESHGGDRVREGKGRRTFFTVNQISRSRIFASTSRDTNSLSPITKRILLSRSGIASKTGLENQNF
jgi:hypothetical protein